MAYKKRKYNKRGPYKIKAREIRVEGQFAYIPLTKGYEAKIDIIDIEKVRSYNWCVFQAADLIYACRASMNRTVFLHRQIMDEPEGNVDHKDGNGLNCIRDNLRIATVSQNGQNRKPSKGKNFKGTCFDKGCEKWFATIDNISLGYFATEIEAAKAYDIAALKYFGEFARTNESMGLFKL